MENGGQETIKTFLIKQKRDAKKGLRLQSRHGDGLSGEPAFADNGLLGAKIAGFLEKCEFGRRQSFSTSAST